MNDRYDSVILHFILRVFMVPLIIVFGVYVLLHGELSPGGGFQAGAIVAAALLLVRLALGNRQAALRVPQGLLIWLACIGLGIYMLGGSCRSSSAQTSWTTPRFPWSGTTSSQVSTAPLALWASSSSNSACSSAWRLSWC